MMHRLCDRLPSRQQVVQVSAPSGRVFSLALTDHPSVIEVTAFSRSNRQKLVQLSSRKLNVDCRPSKIITRITDIRITDINGDDQDGSDWLPIHEVAVGTTAAGPPPRRSRRALLTHRAPPSGFGVEAVTWQRV